MSYAERKAIEARQQGDEARALWWEAVGRRVDQAPPLTPALRAQLAILLRP